MRSCVGLEINSTNTNKMKNKLIIECIALLNTANYDSETLSEKRTEIVESLKEQLRIGGVSSSLTSKEAIDYEIYAKRKDKEENLKSWLYAMLFSVMFFVGLFATLKSCSS